MSGVRPRRCTSSATTRRPSGATRPSVFFTVMFPVILLLIFATVFGGADGRRRAAGSRRPTYYVPAIITLAVISATMQTLAMSLVIAREDGRLKRGRGTPMPAWVFIAGRVGNSIVVALLMLALLAAIGGVLYGVAIPWDRLPAILAHARRRRRLLLLPRHRPDRGDPLPGRRRADRQRAAAAALLPLRRLHPRRPAARAASSHFADLFPVRHFFEAFFDAYVPGAAAPAVAWDNLAVVAIWGVAGLLLAIRFFRWTPARGLSRAGTGRPSAAPV